MLTNKNWTEHAQNTHLIALYIYDKKKNLFIFIYFWIRDIIDLSKSIYNVDFA